MTSKGFDEAGLTRVLRTPLRAFTGCWGPRCAICTSAPCSSLAAGPLGTARVWGIGAWSLLIWRRSTGTVGHVTADGTEMYDTFTKCHPVPARVLHAVAAAKALAFPYCVHPATGRLLAALAAGIGGGVIGETGTGTGVGVAWMLSSAGPDTRILSIELDAERAGTARALFADDPRVTVLEGDANQLAELGPFDMLVLDAPSTPGPLAWDSLDPTVQLHPNGLLVKDDLYPMTVWPPRTFDGAEDTVRAAWLIHPDLFTTEVVVAEGFSVLLGRRRP